MIAGMHNGKGSLYVSDVTGNYSQYHANAIGEGDEKIRETLREKYKSDLTVTKGIKLALDIFKDTKKNFEVDKFELVYLKNGNEKMIRLEGKEIESLK